MYLYTEYVPMVLCIFRMLTLEYEEGSKTWMKKEEDMKNENIHNTG